MTYLNVVEVESSLSGLAAAYPNLCELINLPYHTYEGRTSHALRIGTGPCTNRGILFIGGVHAREWGSCEISVYLAADLLEAYQKGTGLVYGGKSFSATQIKTIVEKRNIIVYPLVNPDGRHYSQNSVALWRRNRNPANSGGNADCIGVDINRNFDFLWDFKNQFNPSATVIVSDNPCELEGTIPGSGTYHGSAAFSEMETQNVRWLFDTYANIGWFIDIHSYSQLILYPWGDDQNQTSNPNMTFSNPAFNKVRGIENDTAYKEYLENKDLILFQSVANRVRNAILSVRNVSYTVQQSFDLYATSGVSDDYAYSRHFQDPAQPKVYPFTIEWGTDFQPSWSEMEQIIQDIDAGLIEFCLATIEYGGSGSSGISNLIRYATWAWIIMLGAIMITPGGISCTTCGPGVTTILGIISIGLGLAGILGNQLQMPQRASSS